MPPSTAGVPKSTTQSHLAEQAARMTPRPPRRRPAMVALSGPACLECEPQRDAANFPRSAGHPRSALSEPPRTIAAHPTASFLQTPGTPLRPQASTVRGSRFASRRGFAGAVVLHTTSVAPVSRRFSVRSRCLRRVTSSTRYLLADGSRGIGHSIVRSGQRIVDTVSSGLSGGVRDSLIFAQGHFYSPGSRRRS